MKLEELKPVLSAPDVVLYLEFKKPLRFEFLNEGIYINKGCTGYEDIMYKEYGEREIEEIYVEDSNTINIDLVNKGYLILCKNNRRHSR